MGATGVAWEAWALAGACLLQEEAEAGGSLPEPPSLPCLHYLEPPVGAVAAA